MQYYSFTVFIPTIVQHLFNVCHTEVFKSRINIQWRISQTQQNFIMFIIVLG